MSIVSDLQGDLDNALRDVEDLQAQCAAMREAIAFALTDSSNPALPQILSKAIWGEAGKALLEDRDRWRATSYSIHPFTVRAHALEEAAQVLEGTDGWPSPQGKNIAAAIRALEENP